MTDYAAATAHADEINLLAACLNGHDPRSTGITPGDFDQPAHGAVWQAMLRILDEGREIDPGSVYAALGPKADGAWILEIYGLPVVPANAPSFAARVRRTADLRGLQDLARGMMQRTLEDLADPGEVAAWVRDKLEGPTGTVRLTETFADALPRVIDQVERGQQAGLSTPWPDLDRKIHGLSDGRLYVVGGRPGGGKALSLDTPLVTPTGWTTMGDVKAGDLLIGDDGKPTRVVAATEVMTGRPCYRVTFDDGETIVADAQHEWLTTTRASRRSEAAARDLVAQRHLPNSWDQRHKREFPSVKTTQHIAETLRVGSDNRINHAVPLPAPMVGEHCDLPVDPYVLGVWLGDGSSRVAQITTPDQQIIDEIRGAGYTMTKLTGPLLYSLSPSLRIPDLAALGLIQNKHIPEMYLRASYEQRLALIQGLMDTDGTARKTGRCMFEVTSRALADGFEELARTLGLKVTRQTRRVKGRCEETSTCYRLGFTTTLPVFRLERKKLRLPTEQRFAHRMIVSVEPIASVPVKCVEVDNASHLYLAGRAMIPTHNSLAGQNLAWHWAHRHGLPVYFASLEMTADDITTRTLAQVSQVALDALLTGKMEERDWDRVGRTTAAMTSAPVHICTDTGQTVDTIRNGARQLQRRAGLGLVVVDYLQLVRPRDMRMTRREQVDEIARGLKLMAGELGVPVVAMTQLNREGARETRPPALSDLRESGEIEQAADVVILLHRPEPDQPEVGQMYVAKARNGSLGPVDVVMRTWYASIDSMGRAA